MTCTISVFSSLSLKPGVAIPESAFLQLITGVLLIVVGSPVPSFCPPMRLLYTPSCASFSQGICCCTRPVFLCTTSLC